MTSKKTYSSADGEYSFFFQEWDNSLCIRECGSTPYVGLARAVSPTNTNFRLTFY